MDNLKFFEKSVKIVDKYGGWKVIQAIVYVALFLFIIFYVPAITKITVERATIQSMETVDKNKEEQHIRNLENRKAIQPQINSVLNSVMTKTNADRAFIIELHNGSNNLNGVPFLHGSVTYEKSRDGVDNIDEEYQNISLSRYEFATYLHNNFSYYGTTDELLKIDKKLAMKLRADGIVYVAVTTLHNGKYEWGWFGVLYGDLENVPQEREITNELMITSQNITNTLQVLQK